MKPLSYFGIGKTIDAGETYQLLNNFYGKILSFFEKEMDIKVNDVKSIEELAEIMIGNESSYSYFWRWVHDNGLPLIKKISESDMVDNDEFLDFIEHRLFILNCDIESGIKDSVFHSIAMSLNELVDRLESRTSK
jgi:hypothetical protein